MSTGNSSITMITQTTGMEVTVKMTDLQEIHVQQVILDALRDFNHMESGDGTILKEIVETASGKIKAIVEEK